MVAALAAAAALGALSAAADGTAEDEKSYQARYAVYDCVVDLSIDTNKGLFPERVPASLNLRTDQELGLDVFADAVEYDHDVIVDRQLQWCSLHEFATFLDD